MPDGGSHVDVTEGVQVLYDALVASLDWGSGLFDTEEVTAIRRLGQACGFAWIDYTMDVCQSCGHLVGRHSGNGDRTCSGTQTWPNGGPRPSVHHPCDCPGYQPPIGDLS